MIKTYTTINQEFQASITEKKSKFIGYLIPVTTEEEAKLALEAIKKEHYNARHHCSAFRIGIDQPLERYADDGEPSGTAGMPMLEVLRGMDLKNVLAVVVRYFGGIKLGTGGLVRAYTEATQAVIGEADLLVKDLKTFMTITVDYTLSGKVEYAIHQKAYWMKETLYDSGVTYQIYVPVDETEGFISELRDMTSAKAEIQTPDQYYVYKLAANIVEEAI